MLSEELMKKYHIKYINGSRYYEIDLSDELPLLDSGSPHLFKYKDIEIKNSSWGQLAVGLLEALDKRNPKTKEEMLTWYYPWSDAKMISDVERVNYSRYKDVYLDTNHTSTHAIMSIQRILYYFDVDPKEATLFVKRHYNSEASEVRDYIRKTTTEEFRNALLIQGFSEERILKILNNFKFLNSTLKSISAYDDLFLFDTLMEFYNCKIRLIAKLKETVGDLSPQYEAGVRYLNYLDAFYRYREAYPKYQKREGLRGEILNLKTEIDNLLTSLNTKAIAFNKLYQSLYIDNYEFLEKIDCVPSNEFITFCGSLLNKYFTMNLIYITKDLIISDSIKEELIYEHFKERDAFKLKEVEAYIEKMCLGKLPNPKNFLKAVSESFMLVSPIDFIRKDKIKISEETLQDYAIRILKDGLQSKDYQLDSKTYFGYLNFPLLGNITWNKYLIYSIASLYPTLFKIQNMTGNLGDFDYVIKLVASKKL